MNKKRFLEKEEIPTGYHEQKEIFTNESMCM